MPKRGKKYLESRKKVDATAKLSFSEAVKIAINSSYAKFDETVDVAVRLGVDPRHADQMVRGTVVLPKADLKFFLRASPEEQARRRHRDYLAQGQNPNFDEILAHILERDKQDREKPISPMVPASDAIIIDTDNLSIEEVLAQLERIVVSK